MWATSGRGHILKLNDKTKQHRLLSDVNLELAPQPTQQTIVHLSEMVHEINRLQHVCGFILVTLA